MRIRWWGGVLLMATTMTEPPSTCARVSGVEHGPPHNKYSHRGEVCARMCVCIFAHTHTYMRAQERLHNCGFIHEETVEPQWCDGFRVGPLVKDGVLPCTKNPKSTELAIPDPTLLATVPITGTRLCRVLAEYATWEFGTLLYTRRLGTLRELAAAAVAQKAHSVHTLALDEAQTFASGMCALPNRALDLVYKYGMMVQIVDRVITQHKARIFHRFFAVYHTAYDWYGTQLPLSVTRLLNRLCLCKPSVGSLQQLLVMANAHIGRVGNATQFQYMTVMRDFLLRLEPIVADMPYCGSGGIDMTLTTVYLDALWEDPSEVRIPLRDCECAS